jgi:hypothetical protein
MTPSNAAVLQNLELPPPFRELHFRSHQVQFSRMHMNRAVGEIRRGGCYLNTGIGACSVGSVLSPDRHSVLTHVFVRDGQYFIIIARDYTSDLQCA